MGVQPGDRVGITGTNSLPWIPAAFGILKAGGVMVPLNDRFVRDELGYLGSVTEPRVVIADAPRTDILRSLAEPPSIAAPLQDGRPYGSSRKA